MKNYFRKIFKIVSFVLLKKYFHRKQQKAVYDANLSVEAYSYDTLSPCYYTPNTDMGTARVGVMSRPNLPSNVCIIQPGNWCMRDDADDRHNQFTGFWAGQKDVSFECVKYTKQPWEYWLPDLPANIGKWQRK